MKLFSAAVFLQLSLMTALGTACHSNRLGELPFAQAPDFSLPDLADTSNQVRLQDVSQKGPVLLAFWASWCPTCRKEIPQLNKLHEEAQNTGLQILSVNVEEKAEHLRQFIGDHPIQYPVLLDQKGEVADRYGLTGLPAILVLAKGGKIVYYGFSIPKDLDELIKGDPA